jgi:ATP-dependent Lhr-like helicase
MSSSVHSIQESLPHTWPVFFARHGNLTRTQQAAIPPIFNGQNTLVIAPTATGKTEAVIAPLLERHLLGRRELQRQGFSLRILYVCPTRALVRDLYERLLTPLTTLGISLMIKSGDTGPLPVQQPPTILLTTPESLDSLLTRAPRLFGTMEAIVLDEIHLFDGTPRGDHLRCLLKRIDHILAFRSRELGHDGVLPLQRVALSATVPNPPALAQRYLVDPGQNEAAAIVKIAGVRRMVGTLQPMSNLHDLVMVLNSQMVGSSRIRKCLIFCNARHEVEQIAAYLREQLPFETAIFVHYSNLDPALRREVEEGLAQAATAICVCTSTLELGIDIGTIDMVILVGPPPSPSAFIQRIGRAGRRRRYAHVIGMACSPLEEIHFQALFHLTETPAGNKSSIVNLQSEHPFNLSVLIQQIFSILKQSPTAGIRLADLRRVAPNSVDDQTLRRLFDHLVSINYLKVGRPGEWRAGSALAELVDTHEIYSNIGDGAQPVVVVDAYTGRPIAQTERMRAPGDTLFIGGKLMEVAWRQQYRLGVRVREAIHGRDHMADAELRVRSAPFAVSLAVSQTVAKLLGFAGGQMALLQSEQGTWLFHFWGDIYSELLAQLLQAQLTQEERYPTATVTYCNEHCIRLTEATTQLPAWDNHLVHQQLDWLLVRLEPFLELGRFHALLPPDLAKQKVAEQVDLPCFEQLYRTANIVRPTAGQQTRLLRLLE